MPTMPNNMINDEISPDAAATNGAHDAMEYKTTMARNEPGQNDGQLPGKETGEKMETAIRNRERAMSNPRLRSATELQRLARDCYAVTLGQLLGDKSEWTAKKLYFDMEVRISRAPCCGVLYEEEWTHGSKLCGGPYPLDMPIEEAVLAVRSRYGDNEDDDDAAEFEAVQIVQDLWRAYVSRPTQELVEGGRPAVALEIPVFAEILTNWSSQDMSLRLSLLEGHPAWDLSNGHDTCSIEGLELPAGTGLRDLVAATLRKNASTVLDYVGACIERSLISAARKEDD